MVYLYTVALVALIFIGDSAKAATSRSEILNSYSVGLNLWGENVLLQSSDGRSENVDIKYSGVSLGYRLAYKLNAWAYWGELNFIFLQGNATSEAKSITYSDSVAGSPGGSAVAGVSYFPDEKVSVSAGAGALYYKLKLRQPTSVVSVYDFRYSAPVKLTAVFALTWDLSSNVAISQNIVSFMDSEVDSLWSVSILYRH